MGPPSRPPLLSTRPVFGDIIPGDRGCCSSSQPPAAGSGASGTGSAHPLPGAAQVSGRTAAAEPRCTRRGAPPSGRRCPRSPQGLHGGSWDSPFSPNQPVRRGARQNHGRFLRGGEPRAAPRPAHGTALRAAHPPPGRGRCGGAAGSGAGSGTHTPPRRAANICIGIWLTNGAGGS